MAARPPQQAAAPQRISGPGLPEGTFKGTETRIDSQGNTVDSFDQEITITKGGGVNGLDRLTLRAVLPGHPVQNFDAAWTQAGDSKLMQPNFQGTGETVQSGSIHSENGRINVELKNAVAHYDWIIQYNAETKQLVRTSLGSRAGVGEYFVLNDFLKQQ